MPLTHATLKSGRRKYKLITKQLFPPSQIIRPSFPFRSVPHNLSHFTFTIFYSGSHIPLTHSYSHFIIKLIYKDMTHFPLTFSTHFSLQILKSVSDQRDPNYAGRREYTTRGKRKFAFLVVVV